MLISNTVPYSALHYVTLHHNVRQTTNSVMTAVPESKRVTALKDNNIVPMTGQTSWALNPKSLPSEGQSAIGRDPSQLRPLTSPKHICHNNNLTCQQQSVTHWLSSVTATVS